MTVPLDPRATVHVARQPILDASGRVFGYELLYRADAQATGCTTQGDLAASRVLTDAVLALDLATLTAKQPAFLNLTHDLVVGEAPTLLPKEAAVFELREDIEVDAQVVDACRNLHGLGYELALDDFVAGSSADILLPYVKFVKVDVLATPPAERDRVARELLAQGIRLVAEKVETMDAVAQARDVGFTLFQGYYFCRPATSSAKAIPARRLAYLNLFNALNNPELTIGELEDLVKHDVSLCYRVVRSVNSAAFGIGREVTSVRHALVLLGIEQVRKWASVWSLAGLNSGRTPETATVALLRARSCEILATTLSGPDLGGEIFLLGLCSLLDAILDCPMTKVLEQITASDESRTALLGGDNVHRTILDAVIAYEQGRWDEAAEHTGKLGLDESLLPSAYTDALRWARELSTGVAVAA